MADIDAEFTAAQTAVKGLSSDPGNDVKLQLYALYKQATSGDVSGKKPGFTDFVGKAKYEAWSKLQGTSQDDAKQRYIDVAATLG